MSAADRIRGLSSDRVFSGGGAGGGGTPPSGGSGTAVTLTDPVTNPTGSAWPEGSLLAPTTTGFQLLDATSATSLASRYAGVVTEAGGIAAAGTGEATVLGRAKVKFKAGLSLLRGDEVFGSTTPGEATHGRPGGGGEIQTNPLPSGAYMQTLGWIEDASSYGTDQTALCVMILGTSREI